MAIADIEYAGYLIPAGWYLLIFLLLTHRMPEIYQDPDLFDPDRFAPPREEDKKQPYSLIGFGGGVHSCIGADFAQMEMKIILSTLLQKYDWTVTPTTAEISPVRRPFMTQKKWWVETVAIFALPYVLIAQTQLPQPSGKWQVGTQNLTWDTPDLSQTDIIAKVWYPTNDRSGKSSPYIDRAGRVFSDVAAINLSFKLIFWLLRRVTTSPASINVMPIDLPNGLPIILFAAGHSTGGAASFVACGQDRRISKAVNLDGAFAETPRTHFSLRSRSVCLAEEGIFKRLRGKLFTIH